MDTRKCKHCGDDFTGKKNKKFCSQNCRVMSHHKNNSLIANNYKKNINNFNKNFNFERYHLVNLNLLYKENKGRIMFLENKIKEAHLLYPNRSKNDLERFLNMYTISQEKTIKKIKEIEEKLKEEI